MIKDKTASLMSTSTKLGAITSFAKYEFKKASFEFGENLGIAFQIKDDLLDILGSSYKTGKDTNADVTFSGTDPVGDGEVYVIVEFNPSATSNEIAGGKIYITPTV